MAGRVNNGDDVTAGGRRRRKGKEKKQGVGVPGSIQRGEGVTISFEDKAVLYRLTVKVGQITIMDTP